MPSREKLFTAYLSTAKDAELVLKAKGLLYADSSYIWKTLQIEFNCTDCPTEIIHKYLSVIEIVDVVLKYKQLYGQPICEITIEESILPEWFDDSLIKANIKFKGDKWVIHKNDKDNFPSNPHAHNYATNSKLHLGNGQLFSGKILSGQIKRKDLIMLRQLIQQRVESLNLPELKIN